MTAGAVGAQPDGPFKFPPAPGATPPDQGRPVQGATGTFGLGLTGSIGGQPFGSRYHLVRLLGSGGMGAVYQAWDQELGVVVAIKVIRPDAMGDPAAARDLERRFKRELLLARNVTHKNVVRIHDLGEVEGVKYITMPYVHGADLGHVLKREGKLSLERALAIARQIAAGLSAAHEAGVVHRDLKPANVMLDQEDHAFITDFGIARSTSGTGGTVAGAVVGTLEYMAPEQARGETVDHRADIYAFGLILFDMLEGRRHIGRGESALAALMTRMSTPLPELRSIDPGIPQPVSDIVAHCTALDPAARYQQTREVVADLDALDSTGHVISGATSVTRTWTTAARPMPVPESHWKISRRALKLGAAALAVLMLATGAYLFRDRWLPASTESAPTAESVSVAVLPFRNLSGDSALDFLGLTLADQLRTQIGQSSSLRTVAAGQVGQILADLRISSESRLDPATLRRLAENLSADFVISGNYLKPGDEIQLIATVHDIRNQRDESVKESAPNEKAVLAAVEKLAGSLREKFALAPAAVNALAAASFKPTSSSLPALGYYNEGLQLLREGKLAEAAKKFEASTQEDRGFALAFARLAQAYSMLGYAAEAERHAQASVALARGLDDAERFMVLGNHARILRNRQGAVDFYRKLAGILPGSDEVLADLAAVYEENASFDEAHAQLSLLIKRDPKNIDALLGLGRVEYRRGRPDAALDPLNQAHALAIGRNNSEAQATALEYLGVAYRMLNKPDDALRSLNGALEIFQRIGRRRGVAEVLHETGKVHQAMGHLDVALKDYGQALKIREEIGDRQGIGDTLNDFGSLYFARSQYDQALAAFNRSLDIQREQRNLNYEGMLLSNIGTVYFVKGDHGLALTYLQQALAIREKINNPKDIAETVYNLAEMYIRMGRYTDAETGYLRALDLRRKTNDEPGVAGVSFSLGTLFGYQGRFDAALTSTREAYEIYQRLKERSDWTVVVFAGYGNALNQIGQAESGQKVLEEAGRLARELKNDSRLAEVLSYQADGLFYKGDFKGARARYDEAVQAATRAHDAPLVLTSKVGLARLAVKDNRAQSAIPDLKGLSAEADRYLMKYVSVASSVLLGEALTVTKQYARARPELEGAIATSERLGLRVLEAQAHHWLAVVSTETGNPTDARRHSQQAQRLLDDIKKDARTDAVVKRADLSFINQ